MEQNPCYIGYMTLFTISKTFLSQLESDLRLQKGLATSAKKYRAELAKLKSELLQGKSLKDSGSGDRTNSEYEMLLNEKDAIIAEYLSGLVSIGSIEHSRMLHTVCDI